MSRTPRAGAIAGAIVIGGAIFTSTTACTPPANCGTVVFIPQSDSLATHIFATKTACSTARALVNAGRTAAHAYSLDGFRCTARRVVPQGLPYRHYTCVGPSGRLVTWDSY